MSHADLVQEVLFELPARLETTTSTAVTVTQTAVAFNSGGGDAGHDGSQHANAGNQLSLRVHGER